MIGIKKNETNPESDEVLAETIIALSDGVNKLLKQKLKRTAIEVLLQHDTKLPKRDIQKVLNAIEQLKVRYCRM